MKNLKLKITRTIKRVPYSLAWAAEKTGEWKCEPWASNGQLVVTVSIGGHDVAAYLLDGGIRYDKDAMLHSYNYGTAANMRPALYAAIGRALQEIDFDEDDSAVYLPCWKDGGGTEGSTAKGRPVHVSG